MALAAVAGCNCHECHSDMLGMSSGHKACIVHYTGATHMGKSTVAMTVRGCGLSRDLGGHLVDMTIAEKMLQMFQARLGQTGYWDPHGLMPCGLPSVRDGGPKGTELRTNTNSG